MQKTAEYVRLDVQGLRAFAVIAVVFFHVGFLFPGGFVGVDMFFVVSGFVITLTLLRGYERDGKLAVGKFYLRRFWRLAPALAVVTLFTLVASALVFSPLGTQQNGALTGLAATVSIGNVAIGLTTGDYFDAPAELNPFLHTWSLGVEEQFYLVFPFVVLAGLAIRRWHHSPRGGLWSVFGVVTALSFLVAIIHPLFPGTLSTTQFFGFYSPVVRAWEFGAGALVALWSLGRRKPMPKRAIPLFYGGGFLMITGSVFFLTGQQTFPGWLTLLPVGGTAALIIAGGSSRWGQQILGAKPLRLVGDWSYSIYLWHWPFVSMAKVLWEDSVMAAPLAAVVSLGPAVASYYLVERRFRYTGQAPIRRLSLAVVGFVGLPAAMAAFFWLFPTAIFGEDLKIAVEVPIGYELGCHVRPELGEEPGVCYWPARDSAPAGEPLYLVGDSNAAHYADGLLEVAENTNRPLSVMTARSCPFLLSDQQGSFLYAEPDDCYHWQESVGLRLKQSPPGVVIISSSDTYWLDDLEALRPAGEPASWGEEQMFADLRNTVRKTVGSLSAAGHTVVIVHTVPHWVGPFSWELSECSLFDVIKGCDEAMPTEFYLTRSANVRKAVEAGATTDAKVLDFLDDVCPQGTCRTRGEGYWIYRDSNHISTTSSRELAPVWHAFLSETR